MTETQVRTIADLMLLPFENKHIKAHKALIHQMDPVQVQVYVLQPQGCIPAHRHSQSWDISIVLDGEIESRHLEDGKTALSVCRRGAVTIVPPGILHEVRNPSQTDGATFLLIQSPSKDFDFLPTLWPEQE
jgi:quercetin dioxygenase-like cupin family protein